MNNFKIVRELTPSLFKEWPVWSEFCDLDEIEELREWGIHKRFVDELLEIAGNGSSHPYYPIPEMARLPARQRIYIASKFHTLSGFELEGMVVNPEPFVIGLFKRAEIELFNLNLIEFWKESERRLRTQFDFGESDIFPLEYDTRFRDSAGIAVKGTFPNP